MFSSRNQLNVDLTHSFVMPSEDFQSEVIRVWTSSIGIYSHQILCSCRKLILNQNMIDIGVNESEKAITQYSIIILPKLRSLSRNWRANPCLLRNTVFIKYLSQ